MKFNLMIAAGILLIGGSCKPKNELTGFVSQKSDINSISNVELPWSDSQNTVSDSLTNLQADNAINFGVDTVKKIFPMDKTMQEKSVSAWDSLKGLIKPDMAGFDRLERWFTYSGYLLQLTGDERFADEMERTLNQGFARFYPERKNEITRLISPYIFTRNGDFAYLNLYAPSVLTYTHTFGGTIEIIQKSFDKSTGKREIIVKTNEKRYVEIYIRIPENVADPAVTVKKVKYVAMPGSYTKVARNWQNIGIIELNF